MSFLTQFTPSEIQQDLTTAYNQSALVPANTGPGSTLGAIFNAETALTVGLQAQIAYVAGIGRLATSTGADIDTFCAPFGIPRETAVAAQFDVAFSTSSPAQSQLTISAYNSATGTGGTYVQTQSGTQFLVIADTSQPGYNAGLGAYVIPISGTTVNATVQAVVPGLGGNAQPNTINQILSVPGYPAPAGISSVNNPSSPTVKGSDAESDSAYIQRFQTTMGSRWATAPAIQAAVAAAEAGLTYTIGDMLDQYGNAKPNFFSVIVAQQGTGAAPSQTLLNTITTVVQNNRPVGMPFTVVGPVLETVNVTATLTLNPGASSSAVVQAAQTAVAAYINGIGMQITGASTTCQYAQILVVLKGISGVSNVTGLLVNSGTADLTATFGEMFSSGTITLATQ